VGKARIFGSLTDDYHQVWKNWFSHINCGSQKNNWKHQSRNLPWTPSYLLGLSKSPLELGVRTKKFKICPTRKNPKKVPTWIMNRISKLVE
jgi:hypothetical protein